MQTKFLKKAAAYVARAIGGALTKCSAGSGRPATRPTRWPMPRSFGRPAGAGWAGGVPAGTLAGPVSV